MAIAIALAVFISLALFSVLFVAAIVIIGCLLCRKDKSKATTPPNKDIWGAAGELPARFPNKNIWG